MALTQHHQFKKLYVVCMEADCFLRQTISTLSILSLVICIVGILVLVYYKLYHSYHYRLVLYLFISFLIKAIINQDEYISNLYVDGCMYWSSIWNIQLCTAFMTADIVFTTMFSLKLRKAEVPLTIACFTLPLVELVIGTRVTDTMKILRFFQYNALLGMAIAGICAVTIATTSFRLAYHSLGSRAICSDNEEQNLIKELTKQRYRNALKKSLPYITYSTPTLVWLLVYYILSYKVQISHILFFTYSTMDACTGTACATIFFVHIAILRKHTMNSETGAMSQHLATAHKKSMRNKE